MSWDLRAQRVTPDALRRPCFFVVPDSTHKVRRGPLKGSVSAQKVLQGSGMKTGELLGGTEEKSTYIPDEGSLISPQAKVSHGLEKPETGMKGATTGVRLLVHF